MPAYSQYSSTLILTWCRPVSDILDHWHKEQILTSAPNTDDDDVLCQQQLFH